MSSYKLTHTALDSQEVQESVGDNLMFYPYEEIPSLKSIDQMLPMSLVLYQLAKTGHFVCVFENSEGVNFFDPLGYAPDSELDLPIEPHLRYQKHETFTYLLKLLEQRTPIIYNSRRYQMKGTSTCGMWCAVRLVCRDLTDDQFWSVWQRIPNRDLVVAKVYYSLSKN